jgi:hypothetical protein
MQINTANDSNEDNEERKNNSNSENHRINNDLEGRCELVDLEVSRRLLGSFERVPRIHLKLQWALCVAHELRQRVP